MVIELDDKYKLKKPVFLYNSFIETQNPFSIFPATITINFRTFMSCQEATQYQLAINHHFPYRRFQGSSTFLCLSNASIILWLKNTPLYGKTTFLCIYQRMAIFIISAFRLLGITLCEHSRILF